MGKIEKTLELNISHELINMADSFWWYLNHSSLKRYWRRSWKLPLFPLPKSYVTGLPIHLEGKAGYGYDVCLHSRGLNGNERAVFIQFKAGEHKKFQKNAKSLFHGDKNNLNPHVKFDINNNGKKNQHLLLQGLEKTNLTPGNPVLYGFPRIVDEDQIKKYAGKLLTKTSFISVGDIDSKAAENGVTIQAGTSHQFRACYDDYKKCEISSTPFSFDRPDRTGDFIAEVVAIRVMRALRNLRIWANQVDALTKTSMNAVAEAFFQYIRYLADYFDTVFPDKAFFDKLEVIRFQKIYETFITLQKGDFKTGSSLESQDRNQEIFFKILDALKPYFKLCSFDWFQDIANIPEAPNQFTFTIPEGGLRIPIIDSNDEIDFDDISYTIY